MKHKVTKDIPTLKYVKCPACNKNRLTKYTNSDGTLTQPSQETVEVRGEERFLEVCQFCVIKYKRQDEKFAKDNLLKLAQAMKLDDEQGSDHKDFSLN
jgi:hypothetical protein